MRCPENRIKAAILHPEPEIRQFALRYFTDAFSRDPSIMPLVIQSVETLGRETAFDLLRAAEKLTQTGPTIAWLIQELEQEYDRKNIQQDNYRCAIAMILCHADPHLLEPLRDRILSTPAFPEQLREDLTLQADRSWDWPAGWESLCQWGYRTWDKDIWSDWEMRQGAAITRALGQFREQGEPIVLPLLARRYRGHDKRLMQKLELQLVILAGEMQLQKAIPLVMERIYEDDDEVGDIVGETLAKIGTDEVIHALAKGWPEGDENYRLAAAEAFEYIHSDLSSRTTLAFLKDAEDIEDACSLGQAALAQLDDDAIEPVRQLLLKEVDQEDFLGDRRTLRWRLVAAATIMEASFSEYPAWYAEAVEKNWGSGHAAEFRLADNLGPDHGFWSFDNDGDEDDLRSDEDFPQAVAEPPPFLLKPIVNHEKKIGRNDPCPCGSGKKYKKCCMNNESPGPALD